MSLQQWLIVLVPVAITVLLIWGSNVLLKIEKFQKWGVFLCYLAFGGVVVSCLIVVDVFIRAVKAG